MNIKEKVKEIMENLLEEKIDDNFSKESTDNWDSFMQVNLVSELEKEFNISFTPLEIGEINSYNDFVNIISKKKGV